tara:strand:- start:2893 stop:4296 length:1404 start_codon:yes stop_codon:yes gene_type:complete
MSFQPSTQQIMSSLNRRLNLIDDELERENEQRQALFTNALIAVDSLDTAIKERKEFRNIKNKTDMLGFHYDKRSNSFYKTSNDGTPLKISYSDMQIMNESSLQSGDSLKQIIHGTDIDGNVDYSNDASHQMTYNDIMKHIEQVNKKDGFWNKKHEHSSDVLNKLYGKDFEKVRMSYNPDKKLDQINLSKDGGLQKINEKLGKNYGNLEEYFADIQSQIDSGEEIDLASLGEFDKWGKRKDTQLAVIGGKLSHVTKGEAMLIALHPEYADMMWEMVGKKVPEINKTTGLPQYGILGSLGSMAPPPLNIAMMGADAIIGGAKAAEAAREKMGQIKDSITQLGKGLIKMGDNKVEETQDVIAQGHTAVEDLAMQTSTSLEAGLDNLAQVEKRSGGLNVGGIETKKENLKLDTAEAADRQKTAIMGATEKQVDTLADNYDTQMSDVQMNIEDLHAQHDALSKQDHWTKNIF